MIGLLNAQTTFLDYLKEHLPLTIILGVIIVLIIALVITMIVMSA